MFGKAVQLVCALTVLYVQAYSPVLQEDGLYHWGNSLFDVARSAEVVEGSPLALVCTSPDTFGTCSFTSPLGSVYSVVGSEVFDVNGAVATGVHAWPENNDNSCGIVLDAYSYENHWETWVCARVDAGEFGYISLGDEVSSNLRLPTDVIPLSYDLYLEPNYASTFLPNGEVPIQFKGTVNITTTLISDGKECISLHADEMNILNVIISSNGEDIPVAKTGYDFQRTFFEICPLGGFPQFSTFVIALEFDVDVVRAGYYQYGLYYKPCTKGSDKTCWYTQGESTNARNIFPCFDEPGEPFKAPISARVVQPDGYSVLSNMGQINENEGNSVIQFQESPAMSVYLFALAVTDYVKQTSYDPTVNVWCSVEDFDAGRGLFGADIGARILDFYGEYFGSPYSLPKMDLVSEEDKFGAMENWGLVLFDPVTLLLDPELIDVEGPEEKRWLVSSVVAHELAHQWFGNLVTLDWWDQMWLNEGFATYVSYLGVEVVDPDNLPWARYILEETFPVMEVDSNTNVHWAMTDPVTTRDDIERKFGSFTYKKGGSVIRMMDGFLSRAVFQQGLSSYLERFSLSSATEDDLFFELDAAGVDSGTWPGTYTGSASFSTIMKTWTNQAGYPLVTANLRCATQEDCKLTLSQKWFVTSGETGGEERLWVVPVTVMFPSGQSTLYWLETSEMEVDVSGSYEAGSNQPIILNDNMASGYFRVNYDVDNWARIANTLGEDVDMIGAFNRAQIACDLPALRQHGDVSSELFDNIIQGWQDEKEQIVVWALDQCVYKKRLPSKLNLRI